MAGQPVTAESGPPRVLVIGAGPAGLATAACLKRQRLAFDLVDRRGIAGGAYHCIYPGITLASPTRYTALPSLPLRTAGEYITASEYRDYLERYALYHDLAPAAAEVLRIERSARRFRVHFAGRAEPILYDAVVAATGMFDFPVWPEIPGLAAPGPAAPDRPAVLHAQAWAGPQAFRGQRLLILGGATSAVELAEQCGRAGLRVTVSARSGIHLAQQRFLGRDVHDWAYLLFEHLPTWALGPYCGRRPTLPGTDLGFTQLRRAGLIHVYNAVERFEGKSAIFAPETASGPAREDFDAIVLATGYRFATPYLPPSVGGAPAGHGLAKDCQSVSWPGLYFVGTPCAATLSSEFLRGIARDALRVARLIGDQCSRKRRAFSPSRTET
jgi:putative flavoprotein involved in K+ transport